MIEKKVIYPVLAVLLVIFVLIALFTLKQWKQLPFETSIVELFPKASTQKNKKVRLPMNTLMTPTTYASPLTNMARAAPFGQQPQQPQQQAPVSLPLRNDSLPLVEKPEQVPEPNFKCSPLTTFTPRVGREYVLYADSACRDFEVYPTSQNYYYKFPSVMYNVQAVDIIQAMIPRGEDQINVNNDIFYIQELPNNPVPITIDRGDYATDALFALEITAKLNAAGLVNTYLVTDSLKKLVFTRTGGVLPYQLLFTKEYDPYQLARQAFGFPPAVVPDVGGIIYGPYKTVLHSIRFVDIVSPEVSRNFLDNPVLARIPLLGGIQDVTEYDPATIGTRTYWPIERITGMTLQFFVGPSCPPLTVLYNFNGLENSLTLKFTNYEYQNIFIDDYCIERML
jgi:hypothetical protein